MLFLLHKNDDIKTGTNIKLSKTIFKAEIEFQTTGINNIPPRIKRENAIILVYSFPMTIGKVRTPTDLSPFVFLSKL